MVIVADKLKKALKKGFIPNKKFLQIYDAVVIIDETKDVSKYDVTDWQDQHQKLEYHYYRIRKGGYRGWFRFDADNTYLEIILPKSEAGDVKLK